MQLISFFTMIIIEKMITFVCELPETQRLLIRSKINKSEKKTMKKIQIINGPNLNLLGTREPSVYGSRPFETCLEELQTAYPACKITCFQSNIEGELINKIHETGFTADGIILNAGALTHTSIALHDAIKAVTAPVIEVHISNVYARESFRHHSCLAPACRGIIAGFGLDSYRLAIEAILKNK
jgi:3-dehydroquinate dehydratase-2